MKAIFLKPRGAYQDDLHSDTLFGLICWAIRQVFSEETLVGLLERFSCGDPPFLVSSAFPFAEKEGERQLFLPRPRLRPAAPTAELDRDESLARKQFKKVSWVPAEHFSDFLQGKQSEDQYYASDLWKTVKPPPVHAVDRLRSRIDRLSGRTDGAGTLFTAREQWIGEGGLYFLLKGEDTERVEASLEFLNDFGWGGKNAIGQSQFHAQVEDRTVFSEAPEGDRFVTLSLYCPHPDELARCRQGDAWYDLVLRKGKVGGHFLHVRDFWKRSVLMFAPGSTFATLPGRPFYGHNPIVKGRADGLDFDVQQFGYAFTAGMRSAEEG